MKKKLDEHLKANSPSEERVKEFVMDNVTDAVAEYIIKSGKNLGDCITYVGTEIHKKYKGGKVAFVDDSEVFNLAMHYFEEGSIAKGTDSSAKIKVIHSKDAPYTKASEHNISQEEFDKIKDELKKYKDAEAKAKATEEKKKETKAKVQKAKAEKVTAKEKDKGAVQMSLFDMEL